VRNFCGSCGEIAEAEICDDGIDNNCDGAIDEGCPGCRDGEVQDCYGGAPDVAGVGA